MRRLIEMGADVQAIERGKYTPLHWATWEGNVEAAELLIRHGADPSFQAKDKRGNLRASALHSAADMRWPQNPKMLEFLIRHGASVDSCDGQGRTPLIVAAAGHCRASMLRVLLDHGADVDATDRHNRTALYLAADSHRVDAAALLIERGANVHVVDTWGYTPLMLACQSGDHVDFIELLIDNGAKVNERANGPHNTALHRAVSAKNLPVVKLLLANGADAQIRDQNGVTPIDIAKQQKLNAIELLLRRSSQMP